MDNDNQITERLAKALERCAAEIDGYWQVRTMPPDHPTVRAWEEAQKALEAYRLAKGESK